jgi:hypothetical protein
MASSSPSTAPRASSADISVVNVFRAALEESIAESSAEAAAPKQKEQGKKPKDPDRYDPRKWSRSKALTTMRISNCCNGCCLIGGAIAAFLIPTGTLLPSFDTVTLSAYVVLLGLLMMCAECNISLLQGKLRNNFGFLFTYLGRSLFIFLWVVVSGSRGIRGATGKGEGRRRQAEGASRAFIVTA